MWCYLAHVALRTSEVVFVEDGRSSQGIAPWVDVVHVEGTAHEDGPVELAPGGFVDQVEPHAHSASRYPEQGYLVWVTSEYLRNVHGRFVVGSPIEQK